MNSDERLQALTDLIATLEVIAVKLIGENSHESV